MPQAVHHKRPLEYVQFDFIWVRKGVAGWCFDYLLHSVRHIYRISVPSAILSYLVLGFHFTHLVPTLNWFDVFCIFFSIHKSSIIFWGFIDFSSFSEQLFIKGGSLFADISFHIFICDQQRPCCYASLRPSACSAPCLWFPSSPSPYFTLEYKNSHLEHGEKNPPRLMRTKYGSIMTDQIAFDWLSIEHSVK